MTVTELYLQREGYHPQSIYLCSLQSHGDVGQGMLLPPIFRTTALSPWTSMAVLDRSSTTNVLEVLDIWTQWFNDGNSIGVVYMNF